MEIPGALATQADSKIVLVVIDGLGGMRTASRGSELFEARTPNLDELARQGSVGLQTPVAPGVTPGSGAGHLALFGYDPFEFELGRGALSAAGVGFDLQPGDVAARVNFCTLDSEGRITDRRAGRIPTEENERLCKMITGEVDIGVQVFLITEREHRALLVLRGGGLLPGVSDTDPQREGVKPLQVLALESEAQRTAELVADLLAQTSKILQDERANSLLLRGFDSVSKLPSIEQRYGLSAVGIAGYPMYRGIARLLGMSVAEPAENPSSVSETLHDSYGEFDFFFLHHKRPDSAGEDGDFDGKVAAIEEIDRSIPPLAELNPGLICVTGDHCTPAPLKSHSHHPVPFVMKGARVAVDQAEVFDEESAISGGLGHVRGKDLMALMLAGAGRLKKFGA